MNNRLLSASILAASVLAGGAQASSFVATTDTIGASLVNGLDTSSSSFDDKRIQAAHDDAAGFIATGGALRTPRLEAALELLRAQQAASSVSDLELAEAILAR